MTLIMSNMKPTEIDVVAMLQWQFAYEYLICIIVQYKMKNENDKQ